MLYKGKKGVNDAARHPKVAQPKLGGGGFWPRVCHGYSIPQHECQTAQLKSQGRIETTRVEIVVIMGLKF